MKFNRSRLARVTLRKLDSLPILGVILFIFASAFPPLDLITQVNLPAHMAQHALIALAGVLIGYPIYLRTKTKGRTPSKEYAISGIFAIATIVIFWHLPAAWDAAVLSPVIHAVEHFSFFFAGILIGFYFPALPDNVKFMTIFLAASGHMVYGLYLYIMPTAVYPLYSVSQQDLLGIFMLFPSPIYFILLIVIPLDRQTKRLELEELASKGEIPFMKSKPSALASLRRTVVPLASVLLISIFVAYLIITAGMIYFPSASASAAIRASPNAATVYIEETPVTWNYAPQNIVVVIGTNNTVVWVSHSLSEDTVTSASNLFNSGVLQPGQTWSYTFSSPGVYQYRCNFHPWMRGTVTVLGSTS